MSYEFYKVLHLLGIFTLLASLGGTAILSLTGKTEERSDARKKLVILHGVALLVVLVAGFGLMARKGMMSTGWPGWLYGKLAIWLVFGAALTFVRRSGDRALWWLLGLPALGGLAAWLVIVQPG